MGGRGASSGGGGGLKGVTRDQEYMISRMKRNAQEQGTISNLKFSNGKNGIVEFTYHNNVTQESGAGYIETSGRVKYRK